MRLLISNDDGVYSPGIAALAEVASEFGEVRIVAPDAERSSASHSITSSRPLTYKRSSIGNFEAYRVNGTPADCVALGVHHWEKVDAVLSGVNLGSNLGNSIWHSGTVAAAKQGALLGLRGIALSSAVGAGDPDFTLLKPTIKEALGLLLLNTDLPLVNVNFPAEKPKGMLWTRQAVRLYDGRMVADEDPMGRSHFWFTVVPITATEEGTDLWAVQRGYVAITPLRLDVTDEKDLRRVSQQHPLAPIHEARRETVKPEPGETGIVPPAPQS